MSDIFWSKAKSSKFTCHSSATDVDDNKLENILIIGDIDKEQETSLRQPLLPIKTIQSSSFPSSSILPLIYDARLGKDLSTMFVLDILLIILEYLGPIIRLFSKTLDYQNENVSDVKLVDQVEMLRVSPEGNLISLLLSNQSTLKKELIWINTKVNKTLLVAETRGPSTVTLPLFNNFDDDDDCEVVIKLEPKYIGTSIHTMHCIDEPPIIALSDIDDTEFVHKDNENKLAHWTWPDFTLWSIKHHGASSIDMHFSSSVSGVILIIIIAALLLGVTGVLFLTSDLPISSMVQMGVGVPSLLICFGTFFGALYLSIKRKSLIFTRKQSIDRDNCSCFSSQRHGCLSRCFGGSCICPYTNLCWPCSCKQITNNNEAEEDQGLTTWYVQAKNLDEAYKKSSKMFLFKKDSKSTNSLLNDNEAKEFKGQDKCFVVALRDCTGNIESLPPTSPLPPILKRKEQKKGCTADGKESETRWFMVRMTPHNGRERIGRMTAIVHENDQGLLQVDLVTDTLSSSHAMLIV